MEIGRATVRRRAASSIIIFTTLLSINFASASTHLPGTYPPAIDNYPSTRFGPGRPSGVTGLRVLRGDGVKKTITLTWNPNPANEHVDDYALYYYSSSRIFPTTDQLGVPAATIDKTSITTELINPVYGCDDYQYYSPYGTNQIPVCPPAKTDWQDFTVRVWVIAHNRNGWGDNYYSALNPDENPDYFTGPSNNQMSRLKAPVELDLNPNNFDKKFNTAPWPSAQFSGNTQSTHAAPKHSAFWNVDWIRPENLPLTRFQPGRPSDIRNLKLAPMDRLKKSLTLTWDKSPAAEHVDEYAIYFEDQLHCPSDICNPLLISIQPNVDFHAKIQFDTSNTLGIHDSKIGVIYLDHNVGYGIWVIAHNEKGWGNNYFITPNPDQQPRDFRFPTSVQQSQFPAPAGGIETTIP